MGYQKKWKRKIKREFKRAVKVEGHDGWFVIIDQSPVNGWPKVKRVGTGEAFYTSPESIYFPTPKPKLP